jgi:hypothetical protein
MEMPAGMTLPAPTKVEKPPTHLALVLKTLAILELLITALVIFLTQ